MQDLNGARHAWAQALRLGLDLDLTVVDFQIRIQPGLAGIRKHSNLRHNTRVLSVRQRISYYNSGGGVNINLANGL